MGATVAASTRPGDHWEAEILDDEVAIILQHLPSRPMRLDSSNVEYTLECVTSRSLTPGGSRRNEREADGTFQSPQTRAADRCGSWLVGFRRGGGPDRRGRRCGCRSDYLTQFGGSFVRVRSPLPGPRLGHP